MILASVEDHLMLHQPSSLTYRDSGWTILASLDYKLEVIFIAITVSTKIIKIVPMSLHYLPTYIHRI